MKYIKNQKNNGEVLDVNISNYMKIKNRNYQCTVKKFIALDPQNHAKSDQSDQNIIPFAKIKRAEKPDKSTLSAL